MHGHGDHGELGLRPSQDAPLGAARRRVRGDGRPLLPAAGSDDWQPFTEAFGKTSPSKFANVTICPGDRVRLIAPGAGGYGDVAERDPAMIAEDLSEGWITPEGARRDYGYG